MDSKLQIVGLMCAITHTVGGMSQGRINSADNEVTKIFNEIMPRNVETSVVRGVDVVKFESELFGPLFGPERPFAEPDLLAPRISHFQQ